MKFKCNLCNDIYDIYACRRYKEKFIVFDEYMTHFRVANTKPACIIGTPPIISTRELKRYGKKTIKLLINNNSVIHIMNEVKIRVIKGDGRIFVPQEIGGCVHA